MHTHNIDTENCTLKEALQLYGQKISILKKSYITEKYRIEQLCKHKIVNKRIADITTVDLAKFRDDRLASVNPRTGTLLSPSTVRLDLALLSDLFRIAMIEWGMVNDNPVLRIKKPKMPPGRDRRLTPREEKQIKRHCAQRNLKEMDIIVTIAIETAMRQGEIIKLTWDNINMRRRIARLPDTKNGTTREVPLTFAARDALIAMGVKSSGKVFSYTSSGIKSSWRNMMKALNIQDLHFHDLRHEATSRLFERGTLDMMEIASITGHKSLAMLKRYTHLKAHRLVKKLEGGNSKSKAALLSNFVPYPVVIKKDKNAYFAELPDFGLSTTKMPCRESSLHEAQLLLLKSIMVNIRSNKQIPLPDHYLDATDHDDVHWIDPIGNCESLAF